MKNHHIRFILLPLFLGVFSFLLWGAEVIFCPYFIFQGEKLMRNNKNCDMFKIFGYDKQRCEQLARPAQEFICKPVKFFGKADILEWHRRLYPLKNPTRPSANISATICRCCKSEIPVGAPCSILKVAGKAGCVICGKCADIIYEEMKIIDGEVPF